MSAHFSRDRINKAVAAIFPHKESRPVMSQTRVQANIPEKPELCWTDIIAHYGGNVSIATEMLCRAALLNERPSVPWDWDEAICNYYTTFRGLAWAIANCPRVFSNEEIGALIMKFATLR